MDAAYTGTFTVSYDHRSYERNLSNWVEKPKKVRTSTGLELVTSRYRCDALTDWAMKPLMLGAGHFWVLMSPWRMVVKRYMKCFIYWTEDLKFQISPYVCEIWLKENFPIHLICPSGLTVLKNDREERRGGGVAIFCGCDWKIVILDEFWNDFECMWARISTPPSVFIYMYSIYHPPEPVYWEEDLLEFLGDTCEQITFMDPNNIIIIMIVIGRDLNELKYTDLLTQASLI